MLGVDLLPGNAVYMSVGNRVEKAHADQEVTARVVGLCACASTPEGRVDIQMRGILTLTISEWDAIAGTDGGLKAGRHYFLSETTPGAIVATTPEKVGHYVVAVGIAISSTEMEIKRGIPHLL
ncbi:hypothetical protein [Fimbriiglobus ruber]|uniref:Uncharacterized protein n=1 Tax=Fimbriiglobus ruber TaxID=1908690 RepID=A0A225D3D2_9BACT|nr:hypothetical protein [Fimbriiglobus ruber]OWK35473.1 hypothetical protein FRUB_08036 [Fimbriiglobus ruber]